jgi:hypothetical protein
MKTLRIARPLSRPIIVACAGAVALIIAGCIYSDAGTRKAMPAKTVTQKPVKLRYYGGPKYPMYPG